MCSMVKGSILNKDIRCSTLLHGDVLWSEDAVVYVCFCCGGDVVVGLVSDKLEKI